MAHRLNDAAQETLDDIVLSYINEQTIIGLDALVSLIPEFSWSQVFSTIDRLARDGRITLRRHGREYSIFSMDYAA